MKLILFTKQLTRQLPKVHLVAFSTGIALLGLILIVVPSENVSAERVTIEVLSPESSQSPAADTQTTSQQLAMASTADKEAAAISADSSKAPAAAPAKAENWLRITVRSGDNLTTLFQKAGLGANAMYPMLNGIKPSKALSRLMPGEALEFLIEDGKLVKLRHEKSRLLSTLISKTDNSYSVEDIERTPETQLVYKQGTIDQSLFLAGQNAGLSQAKIMELASIFGWDVDFALDIRKGDHFNVIYEELMLDGEVIKDGEIVAANFTNQGNEFIAIRHIDKSDMSNYYTPEGKSMRKAFLRTPVDFTRISSRFNPNRKHPIFKTNRPHRGVDYAAPHGTPIRSSGDGKVTFVGKKGGYGKAVIIQHGQRYTTLYAHMSRIKPGMKSGLKVKQGQTIGYVGSTGYATGPHLHYEFRVNGVHRNPLTVPLPHAEPLPKSEMASFQPVAKDMMAMLDSYSKTRFAALSNPDNKSDTSTTLQ